MGLITKRKQQEQYSSDEYDSDTDHSGDEYETDSGDEYETDSGDEYETDSSDEYDSDSDDDVVHTKPTGKDAKTFTAFADAHRPDIKAAHPKMTTAEINQDLIDLWYELTPSEIKLWAAEASKPNKAVDKDKEKQKAKEKAAKAKEKEKAAKAKEKQKAKEKAAKAKKAKT
tara:strand:- start:1 stop:513 length:513 start_codon:yes stop_codon:yes gene_type:complete